MFRNDCSLVRSNSSRKPIASRKNAVVRLRNLRKRSIFQQISGIYMPVFLKMLIVSFSLWLVSDPLDLKICREQLGYRIHVRQKTKGQHPSDERWKPFKGNGGETSERHGPPCIIMCFFWAPYHLELNWPSSSSSSSSSSSNLVFYAQSTITVISAWDTFCHHMLNFLKAYVLKLVYYIQIFLFLKQT